MSANNQTLVVEKEGISYVFLNVTAETWVGRDGVENELLSNDADAKFFCRRDALEFAHDREKEDPTEYGVVEGRLAKDGAEIHLIL